MRHKQVSLALATLSIGWLASVSAAYTPPEYAAKAPAIEKVKATLPSRVAAGASLAVTFEVQAGRQAEAPRRLWLHLVRDGKVMHTAVFPPWPAPGLGSDALPAGRSAKLGPFETTLPADLPGGNYEWHAGVYQEPQTAQGRLTVQAADGNDERVIINTGTFTDKHGVPHRWHVNEAHTLFWDGEPFIPVGGMLIPDGNFDTFKSQIDLLISFGVRDVYWNVGNSLQVPRTWESKNDDQIRLFQRCIDYMDEAGMRYGMQCSGLQAKGNSWQLMGGPNGDITIAPDGSVKLTNPGSDLWLKDGRLHTACRHLSDAVCLISERATGKVVRHHKLEVVHDDRPGESDKPRPDEHRMTRVAINDLPAGDYVVHFNLAWRHDGWNDNMFFWSEETERYYKAIRDLYSQVRMGSGFRFFVDVFWNENNFNHGLVPSAASFRTAYARYLESRYGTIAKLRKAWAVDEETVVPDFAFAAHLLPVRSVRDQRTDTDWDYLVHVESGDLVRCLRSTSQHRYDLVESVGLQVRDFHNEIADVFKQLHDVPVIFKFFSGIDWWHINDAGVPSGFDGVGMESYGVGEPILTFMGIPPLSSCAQATKTMWLLVTEIGEGNHQDQALERNKLFGLTSRLGTAYPTWVSLMGGGAKGLYHYYMLASPGVDNIWSDAMVRDPRQLEWLGTLREIVEHAPGLVDYRPTVYYRFPAIFHPNSGLTFSDPYRDYHNSDTLWFVDPPGKLPNGAWMLPTFSLRPATDMMFINLENTPASLRWADEVKAYLATGQRVTWVGYRRDRGVFPTIDKYYTDEFAKDDDGVEFQVLQPPAGAKIIARNQAGQVWNLIDGQVQIISKNAEVKPGWRPQQVVLDGRDHRFNYAAFMENGLGVRMLEVGPQFEAFTYTAGDEQVTVISLVPHLDSTIRLGEALPPFNLDATSNHREPPPMKPYPVSFTVPPEARSRTRIHRADGTPIPPAQGSGDAFRFELMPDDRTLVSSNNKFSWAPQGILFATHETRATAIIRTPANVAPRFESLATSGTAKTPQGDAAAILIEAERPTASNFNLDVFSALPELSGDAFLGLASQIPPPSPDGYVATYDFEVQREGHYELWVREGVLAMASPGRWRVNDGPWQEATNALVPSQIRLAAQYNALEDERMLFAWYRYGTTQLKPGKHRFSYSVVGKRPGGLDVNLANGTPYAKLIDCFVLTTGDFEPAGRTFTVKPRPSGYRPRGPLANLLVNPSLEADIGGWTAEEWASDRWKWFELRHDDGWHRDLWWTRRAPAQGHLRIEGLMDIGGLQVRQSFAGVRSLRIRAGKPERRFNSTPFAVIAGQRFAFGGHLRADALKAKARVRLRFLDGQGRELAVHATQPLSGTTLWQKVSAISEPAPQNAVLAILDCHTDSGEGGTAWFDDLYTYHLEE